ncbi:MAG: 50S ribosomal protein L6 [Chloroflexi bacterium]|nr:50S ribosomal protein L6 [Chloroflexota bacterium]
MNKKRLVATPYALLLLVLGNPTYPAESNKTFIESLELSLEDLRNVKVATATKTEEQSSLSPAIMTVITAQDIQTYGYDSVAAALRHVASFIDNYDLAVHNFGVRGINSGVRSGSRTIKFMIDGQRIDIKGSKGELGMDVHVQVEIIEEGGVLMFAPRSSDKQAHAIAGTTRALVNNMVTGVSQGFERRLQLQGVGYRADVEGQKLSLQLSA